jgi:hypothetical protein
VDDTKEACRNLITY